VRRGDTIVLRDEQRGGCEPLLVVGVANTEIACARDDGSGTGPGGAVRDAVKNQPPKNSE
jgi:hypothetical protein